MNDWRGPPQDRIATDLVEYLVLVVPGPEALSVVAGELVRIVESAAIRILDLVVVTVTEQEVLEVVEIDSFAGLDAVRDVLARDGVLLSRHDIDLVALALEPGDCAIVLVAEDRWAEPLAAAARAVGGDVRAGERIARQRVEVALAGASNKEQPS